MKRLAAIVFFVLASWAGFGSGCGFADVIETDRFVVEFSARDAELGAHTAEVTAEALDEYELRLPSGNEIIRIRIAESADTFREIFGARAARSIEGFALSELGEIVIKPPRLLRPDAQFDGILRHEILHILLARNTSAEHLPRWFNEGVAMLMSGEIRWSGPAEVARMYMSGTLIPYIRLESSFEDPSDEQLFGDAYAQSLSMTRYLRAELGRDEFWAMVHALRDRPFDEVLHARFGASHLEFYALWRESLGHSALISTIASSVFAFQIAALLVVLAWWRKRRSGRKTIALWEAEEMVERAFGPGRHGGEPLEDELDPWEEDDDEWY